MTLSQLILSQLADPFRIGLIIALVFTMLRTRSATGVWLPLAAGVLFVAVILPTTMGTASPEPLWRQVATGVVANSVILGVVLGIWTAIRRARGG
ncbi:hypothetical protein [Pseudogemmobacter blasticus]|uniref:Uncharacterized protein n=1 Tax=Fuscovulum blasticum DSM 2131 TaxID=1188250 RepID=A0A2T4JCF8_FUSBL|nr:hypothetical protein [Fuscovulum blasticum]PTE15595.1 hypothetical protein C5F44_04270 [Fuscovulum blasticum DSM 2131]